MNDDFLSKFRKSPRPEFAQSLYAKLAKDMHPVQLTGRTTTRRLAYALTVLCLAVFLGVAVLPAAARALEKIIATIRMRGVTVFVDDEPYVPSSGEESYESYSFIWKPLAPSDISDDYPFFAKLPTWIPSGYLLQERVGLYFGNMYGLPKEAVFEWKNNDGTMIQLEVIEGSCPNGAFYDPDGPLHDMRSDCTFSMYIFIGPDSKMESLTISGQPAFLFHGGVWFADLTGSVGKWNPYRGRVPKDPTSGAWMTWERDGRTFFLIVESDTVTRDDIVRMAESIP